MKNFKPLFVTIFLIIATFAQAQDTIYNKNGSIIPAKISEISPTTISYKKLNNLDGPTYVISKANVSFIEYKNGTKDVFTSVPDSSKITTSNVSHDEVYQTQSTTNVVIAPSVGWRWFRGWGWPRCHSSYRPFRGNYYCGRGFHGGFRGGFHGGGFHCGHH
jgi:hypothetical protein